MAGLRLGGLASGMDTEAVISQLMALERRPRVRLELRQAAVQARQDALRDIATKLKTLRTAVSNLTTAATWAQSQTVTSSDPARVGVRAVGEIVPGSYDVEVQQLATTASRTFTTQTRPNTSQISLTNTVTGGTYSISIPPNSTLDQIVAIVNGDDASPVAARNFNGQLLLSAKADGAAGAFTATGQVLAAETASVAGVDARFTVNGVAHTRDSNTVSDAIAGVELTLSGLTAGAVSIAVGAPEIDQNGLAAKVKAFVEAYNAVVDATRSRTAEKRVPNPTTLVDARKGVLFGDMALGNMLSQLRLGVMQPVAVGNSTAIDELAEIGVSTGAPTGGASTADSLNGRLTLDENAFLEAYKNDPASVERLLRGSEGQPGLAARLDGLLTPFTEVGGLLDGRINASGGEVTRLANDIKRVDDRLARKETYLRSQFTALETALSKLNTQSMDLLSRLNTLQPQGR